MKKNWKDMTAKEKALSVAYILIGILTITFAVLDIAKLWNYAHMGWMLSFAALCGIDCLQNWNTKRKNAIIELVVCIVMLGLAVASLFF